MDDTKTAERVTNGVLQRLRSMKRNHRILGRMEEINRDLMQERDLLLVVLIASLRTERSNRVDRLTNLQAMDRYP